MTFKYKTLDQSGAPKDGTIDAINMEVAISALQKRGLVVLSVVPEEEGSFLEKNISFFDKVSNKDVVILSRQMSTLFEAQVSALRVFQLLAMQSENSVLRRKLKDIVDNLQSGSTISGALAKHPDVFSPFYVNMVKSGEESGKLNETFMYLADHLDRTYEVSSKVKTALVYPAFVVFTFIAVMALMLTVVIPKISGILKDSGQAIPIYTKVVLGLSDFLVSYGIFFLIILIIGGFFLFRYSLTKEGKYYFDDIKIKIPYVKNLYIKLYLSRIADNMNTMLISGIPMVRGLELTSSVVDNEVYKKILEETVEDVKGGSSVSDAMIRHEEMPGIFVQMVKIGEETGQLGNILKTLANFYRREVTNSIDALVGLIEPAMIVLLGVGVAFLLASVLIPIYNISSGM
ncbi:MAG: type II secretion system F family protein [Candidatus Paceibacterota bacterium]|nr:type II secretion system F family protein [Candidatus Paceibacterota bacterium]